MGTTRRVPPPQTVCPSCGERGCERVPGASSGNWWPLYRCPACGAEAPQPLLRRYTPAEAAEARGRERERRRAWREAHAAELAAYLADYRARHRDEIELGRRLRLARDPRARERRAACDRARRERLRLADPLRAEKDELARAREALRRYGEALRGHRR